VSSKGLILISEVVLFEAVFNLWPYTMVGIYKVGKVIGNLEY